MTNTLSRCHFVIMQNIKKVRKAKWIPKQFELFIIALEQITRKFEFFRLFITSHNVFSLGGCVKCNIFTFTSKKYNLLNLFLVSIEFQSVLNDFLLINLQKLKFSGNFEQQCCEVSKKVFRTVLQRAPQILIEISSYGYKEKSLNVLSLVLIKSPEILHS